MATDVRNQAEESVPSLVTGIVGDVQHLISQQVQLARAEIKTDLNRLKEAAALLVPGAGLLLTALIVLSLMLVHLFHTLTAPAGTDPASVPLWVWHLIVGAVLAVGGGALCFAAKKQLDAVNPATGPTAQALQQNVQWMSNPK